MDPKINTSALLVTLAGLHELSGSGEIDVGQSWIELAGTLTEHLPALPRCPNTRERGLRRIRTPLLWEDLEEEACWQWTR